jgi:hypothetical protein
MLNDIKLIKCKRSDLEYQAIRNRHYVPNNGCHGQQIHYLITKAETVIGIISGASAVWGVKARDEYLGLTKENKRKGLPSIINNVVYRLEYHEKNLASHVLAMWRKQIDIDWYERYKVKPYAFETFVVEEDYRKGALYKADNWTFLGETAGSTKKHNGLQNKSIRLSTSKKLIFCKKISNRELSTEYTATWNIKGA